MKGIVIKGLAVIIAIASLAVTTVALANVANRYAGRVILFNRRPPTQWASDGVFHTFVRQHKTGGIAAGEDGKWQIEYMAFFRRPVGDREVQVRFFDANDSSGRYITSYTLYLGDPRDRIVGGSARLEQPDFRPNRYYKISVASRGKVIARHKRFALTGDEPERSGEVNFSIEDTRGR